MGHELAFDEAGVARAAYIGEKASVWHREGLYFGDHRFESGAEIIKAARADYDVRVEALYRKNASGEFVRAKYGAAIVREPWANDPEALTNDVVQLGLISGGERGTYQVFQNMDAAPLLDPLVEKGFLTYTSCLALQRGARFVLSAELDHDCVRKNPDGSEDIVKWFLTYHHAHNGRTANQLTLAPTRVVCINTLRSAEASGINVRVPHSGKMQVRLDDAMEKLEVANEKFRTLMDTYRGMARVRANKDLVDEMFMMTFPVYDDEKMISTRRMNQIGEMTRLMFEGAGNGGGTIWDWYNGVTEYLDHVPTSKKATQDDTLVSSWFGQRAQVRDRAWGAASAMLQKHAI